MSNFSVYKIVNVIFSKLVAVIILGLVTTCPIRAADIERPRIQLVDKMGVNLQNGQVTHSLNTVSIGGAMGLSHSVSAYANEFNYPNNRGFSDKYYAVARNVQLCTSPSSCNPMNVMRVHDWSDTADFAYYVGGVLQQSGSATSGYTYTATSDERQILEVSGSEFLWTKPDGTVVHFNRGGTGLAASTGGTLTSVEYPNGFTIWVSQGSVNTNTGFQLKYYFTATNPPLDKTEPPGLQAPAVSPSWPLLNPQYVRGINAWKVFCPWTTATCSAGNEWPTANFVWPAGMPRTMYIGDSTVVVGDSAGRATTYKFRAYDLAYDEFGAVIPPYTPGTQFSPRLKEITPPGASAVKLTYDYKNLFAANMYRMEYRLQTAGVVKSAIRLGISQSYSINVQGVGGDTQNSGGSNGGVYLVDQQNYFGNPSATYYVDTLDGRVWYEETSRNFPRQFNKTAAPIENYYYGTRSNLTRVTYNGGDPVGYEVQAEYPSTCTVSTRKTCNQAIRMRDARGNWTDYAYHTPSGQVEKITYPANKEGVRPETRYYYTQLFATYYNSAGVKVQSSQGIWMKTAEEYCISSAASGGNCTAPLPDEVVTTYEYNHPNLLMTGMVVTAPGGLVRRTCYRYDDFGNQIGVTTPNANLSSCPGVTP
jgi:hypothetical protein